MGEPDLPNLLDSVRRKMDLLISGSVPGPGQSGLSCCNQRDFVMPQDVHLQFKPSPCSKVLSDSLFNLLS